MKNLSSIVVAAIALGSFGAAAADLTEHERAELRQRAQEYQSERTRDPNFEPGEARLNREPGELRAPARSQRSEASSRSKSPKASKASKSSKAHSGERKARASEKTHAKRDKPRIRDRVKQIKKLPGALVR
jgi:hypothetical protein